MKFLFITDFLSRSHFGREPLGVLTLITVLQKQGVDVDLVDISEIKKNVQKVKGFKPHIIGYSIKTGRHLKFINLNKKLKKEFKFISLFGGPHATFFPEIINEDGVDIVCRGEAEEAIKELVSNITRGDFKYTNGFWIKEANRIYKNPMGRLIHNLDVVPFPNRLILEEKYPLFKRFKLRNFISSRGCPFTCAYCHNYALHRLYGDDNVPFVRRRSVDNLINEIMHEKEKNRLNFINFEDDIFVQDKNWLQEFSVIYPRTINLPFHCHVRVDMLSEETISLLKAAGCFSVSLGIETADESIREKVLQRKIANSLILEICNMLKECKINVAIQNMLGIPDTGLNYDLDTLKLSIKCKADYAITSMLTPYPGTRIIELFPFREWDKISDYYTGSPYQVENKKERENLQKIFAITVSIPFLLKFARLLIKFPLGGLYGFIDKFWKYYWGRKKIFPTDFGFRYNFLYIKNFFLNSNEASS